TRREDGLVSGSPPRQDMIVVLRRSPQQRHAADVDRFDGVGMTGAGRDGLDERVEVDDDQIDQFQLAIGKFLEVARFVAARQDARMDVGMQRFHPAIQHLRKPGEFLQRVHGNPGLAQGSLGAAGGVHRHAQVVEAAREIAKSGFIGDAEECVHIVSGSGWPARRLTTTGSNRCSSAWIRSRRLSTVSSGRTSTRRWARIGPWSTSSVTRCTVQPVSLTPACKAMATASMVPAKSGSSDGWMLRIRPSNWRVKTRSRMASYPAQTTNSTSCIRSVLPIARSRALRSGKLASRKSSREMPAFLASSSATQSRLAQTITTRAGYIGSFPASISACRLLPRPETRTPTRSRLMPPPYPPPEGEGILRSLQDLDTAPLGRHDIADHE